MIAIQDAVKNIVEKDIEIKNGMARGLINLSSYARLIRKQVAGLSKKDVSTQSIVVALARVSKKIKAYRYLPEIKISQLSVKTPIVELVYSNTEENQARLGKIADTISFLADPFLSMSTSTQDIAIVVSAEAEGKITKIFSSKPKLVKRGLSAVSIRFNKDLVEESGVGFAIMQKISSRNIVLDEVVSTYNEFTLVFKAEYLSDVLLVIK
jgi:hypothetical protein